MKGFAILAVLILRDSRTHTFQLPCYINCEDCIGYILHHRLFGPQIHISNRLILTTTCVLLLKVCWWLVTDESVVEKGSMSVAVRFELNACGIMEESSQTLDTQPETQRSLKKIVPKRRKMLQREVCQQRPSHEGTPRHTGVESTEDEMLGVDPNSEWSVITRRHKGDSVHVIS